MPILTKSTVTKGSPAAFTLDKGSLVPLISDSYFQDTANWKIVALVYESDTGKQSEKVIFDATQVSPSSNFLISEKARDTFEVKSIMIYDFDGGYYQIPRTSLSPAEFDISLGGIPANPFSARYVALRLDGSFDKTYGGACVFSEIQVIIGGVAKTLAEAGAAIFVTSGFTIVGSISDGSFANDANAYAHAQAITSGITIDLGSIKSIEGIAFSLGGFSGADGMEWTPNMLTLLKSDTAMGMGSMTTVKTENYTRSSFTSGTRKDIVG